ncbi:MAG: hypothetical protein LW807_05760 [Proteobacteria bacterium]|nr:hypothetical protein [Pseudomonadota bacterium]
MRENLQEAFMDYRVKPDNDDNCHTCEGGYPCSIYHNILMLLTIFNYGQL